MAWPHRKLLTLALFTIVVPMGFLTVFKIVGIMPEQPTIAETIVCKPASLKFDRPSNDVHAPAMVNGYVDEGILVNVTTTPLDYSDGRSSPPYNGRDGVTFTLRINVSVFYGSIPYVEFACNVDKDSLIFNGEYYYVKMWNATISKYKTTGDKIYYRFKIDGSFTAIRMNLNWIFLDLGQYDYNTVDHELSANISVTYFNGTAYRKIVIPARIEVEKDVGETFDTAKVIEPSEITGSLDGCDYCDVYAVTLKEGQTIFVSLTIPWDSNFDLYLYDQNFQELVASNHPKNETETIAYTVNATGVYYIKIEWVPWIGHACDGIYKLKIEVLKGA